MSRKTKTEEPKQLTPDAYTAAVNDLHAQGDALYAKYREARSAHDGERADLLRYLLRQLAVEWRELMDVDPVEAADR
jgi:hypothetical protein